MEAPIDAPDKPLNSVSFRMRIAVGLVALALYLPAFMWGVPHATKPDRIYSWGVDDGAPLGPLAEVHNILDTQAHRNFGYPLMHTFMVSVAYSPYMGYLWMSGGLSKPSPTYPYGLEDPVGALRVLAGIAHLLSVLLGVGIVLSALKAGAELWGRRAGLLTAAFAATVFPMFYYSRTGNVDVPVLFFIALATTAYARCITRGFTPRRAAWLGMWAGVAVATKESAAGVFLGLAIGLLLARNSLTDGWRSFGKSALAGLSVALLAMGLASGFFFEPARYIGHVRELAHRVDAIATSGLATVPTFPHTLEGHVGFVAKQAGYLADCLTLPGLLLALAGVVWAVVRGDRRDRLMLLPALGYALYMFLVLRAGQLRYVLPLAFLLVFMSGRIVAAAGGLRHRAPRLLAGFVAAVVLFLAVARGVSLTHAMLHDSRYEAREWLWARLEPGDRVEYFGATQKLPPLPADVVAERATLYLGMWRPTPVDDAKVREILSAWEERKPRYVLLIPDHTSTVDRPYSFTVPPAIAESLIQGKGSYRPVATFETPELLPWVGRPSLDYPSVNPPIRVFERVED